MNFLFPLGMAALGALVPLVLLYMLKQRREDLVVPTNFLWLQALEDLRASSLFQRLRTPLLLILQAAAVALFGLAAAGASLSLDLGEMPRHVIVLLDRSQSMRAKDEDGRTRFEVARQLAQDAVEGLRRGDEMMIVAFDSEARVVTAFTSDPSRLQGALADLAPRDLPSRAADAFLLALSYGQAAKGFATEVVLLSDGAVEDELPDLPFPVTYARLGRSDDNQGIVAVNLTRELGEAPQVFVRVENGSAVASRRQLLLRMGGQVADARDLDLPAGGGTAAFFELPEPEGDGAEVITVELGGADVLAEDDRVSAVLRPAVPRKGLIVRHEPALYLDAEKLEGLHPGLAVAEATPEEAAAMLGAGAGLVDLVCYDGVAPAVLPDVPAQIYLNCLPPGSGLTQTGQLEYPVIIDWDRTHPVTNRCHFDDVWVESSIALRGVERSHALVESTGGPLVLLTPVPGHEVVVTTFPPAGSNVAKKLVWPLFLANTLDFLLAKVRRGGEEAVAPTGTPVRVDGGVTLHVTAPGAMPVDVAPDEQGVAAFIDTHTAGVYSIGAGDQPPDLRAYALLSSEEVRIAPREELTLGGRTLVSNPGAIRRSMLLRDPLLLLALGILILEWAVWTGRR